jgi:hypothetical protein
MQRVAVLSTLEDAERSFTVYDGTSRCSASCPEPIWGKPSWVAQRYGLPRYRVFELIKEGQIRSALIKRKGRKKGMRLVDLHSVDRYLEEHVSLAKEVSNG